MGKSTISMAIFNCYVSSPEGTQIDENDEPETKIATHTQRFGAKLVDIPIISTGEMNLKVSPIVKCSGKSISYCYLYNCNYYYRNDIPILSVL